MSRPFVLVQLSDPHVGATWGGGDPLQRFAAVVESLRSLPGPPDAVLVSGDLTDHGTDAEYASVRDVLGAVDAPVHVLPGNHDDRAALRRHFGVPGAGSEPVQYAVDLGPLRLVALDTTLPGEDAGALDPERLAWLDAALADAPGVPTIVAMHHPPLATGVAAWDAVALPAADRRALAGVVARHGQVERIVAGHVHRPMVAVLAGRPVLTAPSAYLQIRLRLDAQEVDLAAEASGYAVHVLADGGLLSHVRHLDGDRPATAG